MSTNDSGRSALKPMVESVGSDFSERGVTIKQDWFPGYDDKTC
jgi:hypothetical protein